MDFLTNLGQSIYKKSPYSGKTYHGLMNQGATCYLNSVLQVLFMTEDFREAVERHTCDNPGTEFIDLHLKSLFDDLQRYKTYTYKITKQLCIDNVYEQRDAAEYFEKILGLTSSEASQIFHGLLTQKTTCSTCCHETDNDGPFWYLTLALLNSNTRDYSVVDGIDEYFRASHFSGENQMYCDRCDAKSDATMKCVIKHHPEVLMLLLKRFEFDYRYMAYVKNNCTVEVPCTLQIPENQTYELYAVVEHFGDLRCGHYTATIKAQDDERWYGFNDDRVTLLGHQPFQVDNFEKSSSAYLLFYRKKKVNAADTCTQDTGEMSSPGGLPPATSGIYNDQCQDAAKNEPAVDFSILRNEGTEIKAIVSVGSRGVGLSSDLFNEDQDNGVYFRQSNHQVSKEDRNDLSCHAEKQRDKDEIMMVDEEDKRGNAQADNQTEMRASLSGETLEESVDDPVSNMQPQQVCVYMQKDEGKMVIGVNRDEGGDAERRDDEGLDHVKENTYEDQEGTQEVSQDDFKPVSVDKQEDGDDRNAGRGKLLTINDHYNDSIQGSGVGKRKQNTPQDDQRSKRASGSRFYQSPEQPRVEERDVKGDKQQKRGDDEHARRKGASERQEQDQNRSERVTTQRDAGAAKRAKAGNEHLQRRADSSLRQAGLAGSSRVAENRGDGSVEKSEPSKARTQDTGEMSSPVGFPPATSGIYNDQCQDAAKRRQKVEWAATAGNEPAVAFSVHTNEGTEIKAIVSVGSRGVGLSSDLFNEDQDNGVYFRQSNHQVSKEDRNDLSCHAEKQRDKDEIMMVDEEDKRGNAQADNQTEMRASLSGETLEESVDDPVSNMQPQQVCVAMQKDEGKMVMGVNRDTGGDAERRDDEGLDHVKQNMYEDQEGTQEVGQDDFKPVSVDKQEDVERMETDDEERKAGKGKLLTRYDLYNDGIQGSGVGTKKQNTSQDDQRSKRGSGSRFYQSPEQLRVEERDVNGDKQQKRGDDEHARRKGASERQEQDQNRSERVTTQRDAGALKRTKGVQTSESD
ncbi:hypothetical protein VZT92_017186 [Zoarces viviparus]|uniref:USP domain-containing protein n=1 Tax=Zoarces viviparus TaxID=48416 RepID=A0AAW1ES79_ZOAVI